MSQLPSVPCPVYAPLIGALGIASALVFTSIGAAYGTAKAGLGIINVSIMRPDLMIRSSLPVIMAGIVALYGVITDVIILSGAFNKKFDYSLYSASLHLAAGLSVGLSGLAAGIAIGIVGDAGVRGVAQQPRLFVGMVLILIFAEVLGLYGFFLSIVMSNSANVQITCIRP